jgi:hypothetical protein
VATLSTLTPRSEARLEAPKPLHLWHLTSLDAPTVAIVWTLAFAWAEQIRLPIWLAAVVGLCCWCCYIADRLLDAHHAGTPLRPRHHFHWKHRRVFFPLAVGAGIAAAALTYCTSGHARWRPDVRGIRVPKELLVGAIFTLACAAPAWTRAAGARLALLMPVLIFIALAWLNCHAIEAWESVERSQRDMAILRAAAALAGASLLAAALAAGLHELRTALLLGAAAVSAALLGLLGRNRERLTPTTLRAAADLVLLTPLALLLLP